MDEVALSVAVGRVNDTGLLDEETYWQLQWKIMEEEAPA